MCFCVKFPEYIIPDEELYDGQNAPLILLSVYTYQVICETDGIIRNVPTLWKPCEENDDIKNSITKRPTYANNKQLEKNAMFYWWISHGRLSENVKEIFISKDVTLFTWKRWVQEFKKKIFFDNNSVITEIWLFWSIEGIIWHGYSVRCI